MIVFKIQTIRCTKCLIKWYYCYNLQKFWIIKRMIYFMFILFVTLLWDLQKGSVFIQVYFVCSFKVWHVWNEFRSTAEIAICLLSTDKRTFAHVSWLSSVFNLKRERDHISVKTYAIGTWRNNFCESPWIVSGTIFHSVIKYNLSWNKRLESVDEINLYWKKNIRVKKKVCS